MCIRDRVEYAGLYEVVNGWHKGSNIGLTNVNEGAVGATTKLTAINKNNEKISHEYTINVVLDTAKTGNTLNSLEFTAQRTTNNNDKVVYRAIQRTGSQKNTFNAEVDQQSNLTNNVGNITLEVPVSLSNNPAYAAADPVISYHNVVTGFATDNGGVAYVGVGRDGTNYILKRLDATTNDISDKVLTGSTIDTDWKSVNGPYDQIIVLPEKYARAVELTTPGDPSTGTIDTDVMEQYGTVYNIVVEVAKAQTGHDLQSMSFGNTPLTIEGDTITVSYTHLDVHKRQKPPCGPGRRLPPRRTRALFSRPFWQAPARTAAYPWPPPFLRGRGCLLYTSRCV